MKKYFTFSVKCVLVQNMTLWMWRHFLNLCVNYAFYVSIPVQYTWTQRPHLGLSIQWNKWQSMCRHFQQPHISHRAMSWAINITSPMPNTPRAQIHETGCGTKPWACGWPTSGNDCMTLNMFIFSEIMGIAMAIVQSSSCKIHILHG